MVFMRILFLLLLLSCSKVVQHGVVVGQKDIHVVMPNITRKYDVRNLLGTPSFIWKEKWYYISTKKRYKAFFKPTVVEHDAYVIAFNGEVVASVQHFTKNDIQPTIVKVYNIKILKPDAKKLFE
ncbi:MAG: outer membrane protein assembly factor BamE (lipoprotein component of BamABCDE complex) [Candidatus Deianiraeaceae bacterium]|jgi:outer membrane protein assembly factor BamE (lipoprotein component of BamABCDE complex)